MLSESDADAATIKVLNEVYEASMQTEGPVR